MAQAGYTPIQLYYSTTTTNVPTSGNLASGELAINITDGKLFYKDNGGSVQVIAWKTTPTTAGGTGLTSWTAGDLPYYATGTTLSKLGIGTNGQVLTSTGTAPQWSTLSGVAVTTFSAGTTGFTPSSATSGAVTLAGTLATTNGGTGLTSFTANGVVYASSTSALTTGSALSFDGTKLTQTVSTTAAAGVAEFKNSATNAQTANIIASNDAGTALTMRVFGSAAGTYGMVVAGSPIISTTASELNFVADNASGVIKWGLNGAVEAMRLTSTGLGIGTTSPSYKLNVVGANGGTTNLFQVGINAVTNGFSINTDASNNIVYSFLTKTGAAGIYQDASGNVGIGTTSPNEKLVVSGGCLQVTGSLQSLNRPSSSVVDFLSGATRFFSIGADSSTYGSFSFRNATTTANTEVMAIDSAGNLGLGVTPSAWSSSRALQILSTSLYNNTANDTFVGTNYYYDGANNRYINTDFAAAYGQVDGTHRWFTAASGTAGNIATFTQAMTLDASGNLGVGATSPLDKLDVVSANATYRNRIRNSGANEASLLFQNSSTGTTIGDGLYLGIVATTEAYLWNYENTPIIFGTNGTERARITSVGNFSLGTHADRGTTVGTNAIQIFNGTAPAGTLTNGVSLYSSSGDLNFMNSAGNGFRVGYRNLPPVGTQTGSYTLAAGDVGKYVQVSTGGSITIPTSVFAEGDAISIYNNTTGNITITCSAPTAYIAGTNTVKTSMTLATRGVATVLFYSATACVVSGNVT